MVFIYWSIAINNERGLLYIELIHQYTFQVFQRRMDGKVSFDRGWEQYLKGFGNVAKEHWLGKSFY